MSDASKVKRWELSSKSSDEIEITPSPQGDWVKIEDHDRVAAELENRLYEYNKETSELRAEVEELRKSECLPFDAYYKTCEVHYGLLNEEFKKAEATIARQARMIEKARQLYSNAVNLLDKRSEDKTYTVEDVLARYDKELADIEQGEGTP